MYGVIPGLRIALTDNRFSFPLLCPPGAEECCHDCCYSTPYVTLGAVSLSFLGLMGFTISSIYGLAIMDGVPHVQNGCASDYTGVAYPREREREREREGVAVCVRGVIICYCFTSCAAIWISYVCYCLKSWAGVASGRQSPLASPAARAKLFSPLSEIPKKWHVLNDAWQTWACVCMSVVTVLLADY